jgi:translation initiation factor IF-3
VKHTKPEQNTNLDKLFRINEQIKVKEVRLIDQDGKVVGVVLLQDALKKAQEAELDLVEVSPNVNPPVCKIANFGKMKYEMQKKASDAKKKQKVVEVKEIKMSLNIGKSDYDVKIKHSREFVEKGNKVKISIRMRGREITHLELAKEMMENILKATEEFAKPEVQPRLEGMQMVVTLVKK